MAFDQSNRGSRPAGKAPAASQPQRAASSRSSPDTAISGRAANTLTEYLRYEQDAPPPFSGGGGGNSGEKYQRHKMIPFIARRMADDYYRNVGNRQLPSDSENPKPKELAQAESNRNGGGKKNSCTR